MELVVASEALIKQVLDAAFVIHKEFGPGLLESVYEKAMLAELQYNGISAVSQLEVPVYYRDSNLGTAFRADLVVENSLIVELKTVDKIIDLHIAQVITYLKLMKYKRGLLINFNSTLLKNGIKRVSI